MSKLIHRRLKVVENHVHKPLRVHWQGRWINVVSILDRWYDTGKWWEGESVKLFFRVQLEGNRVWELFFDHDQKSWNLYKIYD